MKRQALRWIALVLALVMSLSLAACSSKQDTAANDTTGTPAADTAADTQTPSASDDGTNVIKIGLMLQLSGSSPADSEELLKGCQKIADIINNETDYNLPLAATAGLPNLNGAKIEIVVGDAATNDAAMSECQRLITEEGVAGFAGILGSSGVKVCATAFEKYGIPYVTNASSPSLTTSGYEYLVRIFPDDSLYCRSMFEMVDEMNKEQDAGIKTIALCSEDSEFGVNIDTIEADLAAEYGLELVEHISYSASATNVTSEVLKLKAADADVVMFSSYTADAILFMQTFKEQNYYPKMLVGQRGGFSRTEMFQTVPEAMQYVYNTCAWASDLDQPNVQMMCDLYQEVTGNPAQEGPMRAMTDFYTLCLAINQAGSTDPDAIMEQYRAGIEIPADQKWIPVDVKIDENGQNLEASTLVLQAFDGVYKTVYPFDVASTDYVYPVPGWSER